MADKYVDTARQNGNPAKGRESSGRTPRLRTITFDTAAADTIGDIHRLFTVGAHEIPVRLDIVTDGVTGASDIDVGLYRPTTGGAVVDADALADGIDLSSGVAWSSPTDGLSALGIAERGILPFYEIANDVETGDVVGAIPHDSYDIAMTQNSEVSEADTITVLLWTIDDH